MIDSLELSFLLYEASIRLKRDKKIYLRETKKKKNLFPIKLYNISTLYFNVI